MATGRLPDPNTAPVTAKGDLYTYSTVPAKLAVGSNGDTLLADSAATTGLRWQPQFLAGKNKIINGDFNINQRAFTSLTADQAYGFDRWILQASSGTTYTPQTFTAGTAPVAGYEARNFARLVTTGQTATSTYSILTQRIESVRTFANQTITVSFWAKAGTGTPAVAVDLTQAFGTGGSPSAAVSTAFGKVTISTSWARYTVTATIPSISGKTIGTTTDGFLELNLWTSAGTDFNARTTSLGIQTATIEFWGVQVEAGSVATPFLTATGTLQGELAACQRYYVRFIGNGGNDILSGLGWAPQTTNAHILFPFPVQMRIAPSGIESNIVELTDLVNEISVGTLTLSNNSTSFSGQVNCATSGLTQMRPYVIRNDNDAAGYVAFTAEL